MKPEYDYQLSLKMNWSTGEASEYWLLLNPGQDKLNALNWQNQVYRAFKAPSDPVIVYYLIS